MQGSNWDNSVVVEKMEELTEFEYDDSYSLSLLKTSGLAVEDREEVQLASRVKYTGEWAGDKRHGKGI